MRLNIAWLNELGGIFLIGFFIFIAIKRHVIEESKLLGEHRFTIATVNEISYGSEGGPDADFQYCVNGKVYKSFEPFDGSKYKITVGDEFLLQYYPPSPDIGRIIFDQPVFDSIHLNLQIDNYESQHFYGVSDAVKEVGLIVTYKSIADKSLLIYMRSELPKENDKIICSDSIDHFLLNDDSAIIIRFNTPPVESYHLKASNGSLKLMGLENFAIQNGGWIYSRHKLTVSDEKRILCRIESDIVAPYERSSQK
jgi:hypothetical protein